MMTLLVGNKKQTTARDFGEEDIIDDDHRS